jgi:leucyl-tRNA synthetase
MDNKNDQQLVSPERENYRGNVDVYVGGAEHVTRHMIYARFWQKFLYDIGVVPTSEPYKKRTSHGMILASDGEKMSKSRGNVINPDEMVDRFGTDAFRTYIMFMGPFDQAVAWDTNGLVGVRRFLEKVWLLSEKVVKDSDEKSKVKSQKSKVDTLLHQTIKKVSEDIEAMRFNTAVAQLMILVNEMIKEEQISLISYLLLLQLLSPFAPHMSEELWLTLGNKESIAFSEWPKYDPELAKSDSFTLAVQVNGKLRDTLEVPANISESEAKEKALGAENVSMVLKAELLLK